MSTITLPGDIPGLLRRGSPVFAYSDRPKVVDHIRPDGIASLGAHAAVGLAAIALDLTDATGRAHATWWLGRRYTVTRSPYGCVFTRVNGGWVLRCGYSDLAVWTYEQLGVDPEDRRSLPDGSSWLDAEALRIACLRAAGVRL